MNSTHGGKSNNFFLRLLLRDYRFLTIIKEYLLVPINHRPGNKTVKIFKRNDSPKDALLLEHTTNICFPETLKVGLLWALLYSANELEPFVFSVNMNVSSLLLT